MGPSPQVTFPNTERLTGRYLQREGVRSWPDSLPNDDERVVVPKGVKTPSSSRGSSSMTRLRSLPFALGALAVSAGVVAAFTVLPSAATDGLEKASDASGRTVPARPAALPAPAAQDAETEAVTLPDAASHGTDVSTVA